MAKKIRFLAANDRTADAPQFDKGSGDLFETTGLPESGDENDACDDEQQATGGGAPATTIPGPPMKDPMSASDVQTPSLPQRSAAVLQRIAADVLRQTKDRALSRRIAAIARQIVAYEVDQLTEAPDDLLSTGGLPLSGNESADKGLVGGNDPPKTEVGPDQSGKIEVWGTDVPKADMVNAAGPVASIYAVTYQTRDKQGWSTGLAHVTAPSQQVARERFAAVMPKAKIKAATLLSEKTQSNNSTKVARKTPAKKTRKASAPKTPWAAIRDALSRTASASHYNGGRVEVKFEAVGGRVAELTGVAIDAEGSVYPVGTVSFRLSSEDRDGRIAQLEVQDAAVNNETQIVGVPVKAASRFASRWAKEITNVAQEILTR